MKKIFIVLVFLMGYLFNYMLFLIFEKEIRALAQLIVEII